MTREEIAAALKRVHVAAKSFGGNILPTSQIAREDRELLVRTHWLQLIIQGWYMLVTPEAREGDSTTWYANFWDFVHIYLEYHYDKQYCLSAENSIDLHLCSSTIPKQVITMITKKGGAPIQLPYQTSILAYGDPQATLEDRVTINGIQVMDLSYALCKVTPSFFQRDPRNGEIALRMVRSPEDLLRIIIKYKFKTAAGRLIGAYRFIGDIQFAERLEKGLTNEGFYINVDNPFTHPAPLTKTRERSPYAAKIYALWEDYREDVLSCFPQEIGLPKDKGVYFTQLDSLYNQDAYHSLSIEGYQVDEALIDRVRNNLWNPQLDLEDQRTRNALAARGYYEAFQELKKTIYSVFEGMNSGEAFQRDHQILYQKLFSPSVDAGMLRNIDLIGYRRSSVYIRNSRHIPLPKEAILDAMEALFICLKQEPSAAVRAVLGHYIFVYIHPYIDGNGRTARFMMNTMLASGGYPWTIIHIERRDQYIHALETAHVEHAILPLAKLISSEMLYRS